MADPFNPAARWDGEVLKLRSFCGGQAIVSVWPTPRAYVRFSGQHWPWRRMAPTFMDISLPWLDVSGTWPDHAPPSADFSANPAEPSGQLLFAWADSLKNIRTRAQVEVLRQCFKSIPQPVRDALEVHRAAAWEPLRFYAAAGPEALEFRQGNPALSFMLAAASHWRRSIRPGPMAGALKMLRRRRRKIAEWLGFPGEDRVVNILARVAPEAIKTATLRELRRGFRRHPDLVRLLAHMPQVTAPVVEIAVKEWLRRHVAPKFLLELAAGSAACGKDNPRVVLEGALVLADLLGRSPLQKEYFQSLSQLREAREDWRRTLAKRKVKWGPREFPQPPFPGAVGIQPIADERQVILEAQEQWNCSASHLDAVIAREEFLYRTVAPLERATVLLAYDQVGRRWRLDEVKAPHNREVRPETLATVGSWLREQQRPTHTADVRGAA